MWFGVCLQTELVARWAIFNRPLNADLDGGLQCCL